MAAVTSASALSTLLFLCVSPVFACVVQNIRARPGENVFLPCSAQKNSDAVLIEWSRRFQTQNVPRNIFLYRDGWFDPENQHQSNQNRVELKDEQMKDGDVSLILKSVIISDTGTYECRVIQTGTDQVKTTETICIINLTVFQPGADEHGGDKDGKFGLAGAVVVLVVGLLVVTGIIGVLIYRKCKGPKNYNASYKAPDEKDTEHQ